MSLFIRSFIAKLKYYFSIPADYRNYIANKNLERTFIALISTLALSIIALLAFIIPNFNNLESIKLHIIFISIYIAICLLGLLMYLLIKRFFLDVPFLKELAFYLTASLGTLDCLYSLQSQGTIFNALAIFITMDIVISMCFTIHPLYYIIFASFIAIKLSPVIFELYHFDGLLCCTILFGILVALTLYKWANEKRLFLKEINLNYYKQALQSEVERQTDELKQKNEKIISIQNHTIISLSNLVENRDSDTGEHVRRTSAYVVALAKKARDDGFYKDTLTENFITYLAKAAPMHDIGKIVVPDAILKKPGKLTDEEFTEMKKHASEGGRIVKEVLSAAEEEEYVQIASDIATYHHEKWDGTGYPQKLKLYEIPLSARIMALADVFDALVSPRCYKEPFTPEKAFNIIKESSGTHFDPILTAEFLLIKDEILQIMNKYNS